MRGADALAGAQWSLSRRAPGQQGAEGPEQATADGRASEAGRATSSEQVTPSERGALPGHQAAPVTVAARVPGTVTGALRDALGEAAVDEVLAQVPDAAWEYRTSVTTAGGPHRFVSAGIATVSELVVAGETVHACESAFAPWDVTVELPAGACEVLLRILPTAGVAVPRKPRARWLSPLVSDRSMRWRRTPLVGSIDWPGARPVLGPWGGLSAVPAPSSPAVAVRTRVTEDGRGLVSVDLTGPAADTGWRVTVEPGDGGSAVVERTVSAAPHAAHERTAEAPDPSTGCARTVELPVADPLLWWPHGTGPQNLYTVRVRGGEEEQTFRVGFRTVAAEPRRRGHRGLALRVNGVPVFARGAVWTGADPFEVAADPQRTRAVLSRLRAAGTTMVRVPGTSCYETEDFHRACDELGLMVWQDVALGPLDPPDDPAWREGLRAEVRALAARLAAHPSTVVVSGGTEVIQAPVLAGRPADQWVPEVLLREIPQAVGEAGADVVVVPSSPCSDAHLDAALEAYEAALGGHVTRSAAVVGSADGTHPADCVDHADLTACADTTDALEPTRTTCAADSAGPADRQGPADGGPTASSSLVPPGSPVDAADGVSHYFGVGAYGRPLEDAVTRGVRFAAESLAFAVPPEPDAVRAQFGTDAPLDDAATAPAWRAGVARDPGAAWSFADTTAQYVHRLFLDRESDPEAGLAVPARPAPDGGSAGHAARLELERATLAHVFQRTFAQWRAGESACRGALVLSASSTAPGAGWGVLDVTGRPTAAWYGMRRACAPVAVSFVPAGGDGLRVHVWNDAPQPLTATLRLTVATVRGGCQAPVDVPLTVPAHGETVLRADLADGSFRDLDNAYGFGAREYDAVSAVLLSGSDRVLARDAHLTGGPRRDDAADPVLDARWVHSEADGWAVAVSAAGLARFVALDLPLEGIPAGAHADATHSDAAHPDTAHTSTAHPDAGPSDGAHPRGAGSGSARCGAGPTGATAEDGYVHVLPGETVLIPVSGDVTEHVRAGSRVRALGVPPVPVAAAG